MEVGIFAALGQSTGGPIGFDAQRRMACAIRPLAGHRHHPVGDVSELAQVLLCRQDDAVAALGIARLIDDQHPTRVRA